MATSSYANLFGTNGAGQQGSQAGISTMFGQQATGESEEEKRRKAQQAQQQQGGQAPQQTFAQMQQAGQARPAPPPAGGAQPAQQPSQTVQQLQQQFPQMAGGAQAQQAAQAPAQAPAQPRPQAAQQPASQMAPQAAPGTQPQGYEGMLGTLQEQLKKALEQPSGYTSPEFQQLREAQMGQLQQEFGAQRQALEEDLARRGLSASSIGAGRMGDLAGQQSQAMANLQAQLLQQQAEMTQRGKETTLKTFAEVTGQVGTRGLGEQEIDVKRKQLEQEAEQFGMTLNEQQAERMQRFGISTQELGLRAQEIQQRAALEGRQMDITEAQNEAQNSIEREKIVQQGQQFGLQLDEQKASRLQQFDISTQELGIRAQQLQQEARLQGRQMDITEAQNLAQNELEEQRIDAQQGQFSEQLRFNREELALRGDLGKGEQDIALARLAQEGRLEEARQNIQIKEVEQRQSQFDEQIRFNRDELALRGDLGRGEQELAERRLTQEGRLEEARQSLQDKQATQQLTFNREELALRGELGRGEQEIAERRLQQEGRLEEARQSIQLKEMGQREDQFTRSLDAESQRFLATIEEQRANRLQQLGISTRELDIRADQIKTEQGFRGTEISMQQARDDAEVAYRAEQLAQQLEMQGRQFNFDELRQQAQLDFQREQGELDAALRREGYTVDRERINQAREQFDRSFGFQERQADEDLIMRLGDIFSKSDDPKAAEQIAPLMQQLMNRLRGQGGGQQGGQGGGQGGGQTQTATATGPIGTVGPTGETTTAPKTPTYTPPAYTPPANNPYNNPLGPTSGPEPMVQQMPNFDEILRFGEESYNPYDTYGYDPYAGYGGAY